MELNDVLFFAKPLCMENRVFIVEKLVAGGAGIVRDGAETIFIPYVIPGEKIRIRKEPGSKKPVRAIAIEIIAASPDRVEAPCPLFGRCGGCQLQHIKYETQLRLKHEILSESIARIAKIRPDIKPVVPSPKPFNYRSRIKLQVVNGAAGFYAERKKEFLPVEYCRLAYDTLNRAIPTLPDLIARHKPKTIELIHENDIQIAALIESRSGRKIFRGKIERSRENSEMWTPAHGQKIAFQQVNREQNDFLRKLISKTVSEIGLDGVIELYAGAGNLTEAILANSKWIVAVDADREAVQLGKEKFGNISPQHLKFVCKKSEDFLTYAREKALKPDLILLDPPRTGAKEAIEGIVNLKPESLIYVSCDPATLARDLKSLIANSYELRSITPIDMFPQTAHIEAVAVLTR